MNNPAYERLLQDYVDYHLALVVVGGFFTVVLLGFAMFSWLRARNAPKGVERRTHLAFALASSVVGLLLAVVVAGNLSNVLNPQQGLAGAIGTPGDLKPAASAELTTSLRQWLRSGSADVPTVIQQQVDAFFVGWKGNRSGLARSWCTGGQPETAHKQQPPERAHPNPARAPDGHLTRSRPNQPSVAAGC